MSGTLRVLQVFPAGRSTTNPYLVMLADALRGHDGVEVSNFTWRSSLLSSYDVVHLHWPENLGSGHSPLKRVVRQVLTLLLVAKWRLSRTAVVRTLHNVHPPTGISRRERGLLRLIDRVTDHFIILNVHTPVTRGRPATLVPHGHYRGWFDRHARSELVRGQFGFAGLIRGYKGVEQLVTAFRSVAQAETSLLVAGNPSSPDLARDLRELAGGAGNIRFDLRFLPDEDLVRVIGTSELVVLPYRFMHNSGGLLAALSLERPVLVPRNEVTTDMAVEVGPGWVHLFDGDLSAQDLESALRSVRDTPPTGAPDLSARGWREAGSLHVQAYRSALALVRGRRANARGTGTR